MSSAATSAYSATASDGVQEESIALARLLEVSTTVLRQAVDLLENGIASNEQLTTHSNYIPGSTIGKHLRHARDHFVLLLEAVSTPPPHVLSYDKRARNTPMESDQLAAIEALNDCIATLHEAIPNARMKQPITLHAVTPYPQVMETTFGRELWFAALHAIHHWSMVRVMAGELGIKLEDSFGFAPSTLVHMESKSELSKM